MLTRGTGPGAPQAPLFESHAKEAAKVAFNEFEDTPDAENAMAKLLDSVSTSQELGGALTWQCARANVFQ
jgi:hypothetical protein